MRWRRPRTDRHRAGRYPKRSGFAIRCPTSHNGERASERRHGTKGIVSRMTWSIVARNASGALGVIVASRFFAVGALCPHAHGGIGALSTQALVNPLYGPRGLALLAQAMASVDVVRSLISADAGREHRQVHLIDAEGRTAAHTGVECIA